MKIRISQYRHDPTASMTQNREIRRVEEKIEMIVKKFCMERCGQLFHMQDLEDFVSQYKTISPGSAARLLRELRKNREIGYEVINRRKSVYQINWVNEEGSL